jgi:predicted PolB exonuclease-like 3'-5' exonuclease
MDVLSGYQPRAAVGLDQIATLLGFPGKLGMDGSQVWARYQAGDLKAIRDYCETDVLNTYLIYLRYELMRGHLSPAAYQDECRELRTVLETEGKAHLDEFLEAWQESRTVTATS